MNNITCNTNLDKDIKIIKKKASKGHFMVTVGVITIKNIKYIVRILKKLVYNYVIKEYIFYKKYSNKIISDGLEKNISIPFKIIECDNENKYIMFFNNVSYDYNRKYIVTKLFFKEWLDYTIQLCLIVYYLNHELQIFHNDIGVGGNLQNQMIQENNKPFEIKVKNFKYQVNNNYIVLIDFEFASNKPEYMTKKFYFNDNVKSYHKYISEVFVVFYISYKIFFNIDDKWANNYDKIYDDFIKEMNNPNATLKDFDNHIINSLFLLEEKIIF
jgi:hypothetical protein